MEEWKTDYSKKLCTADEAVQLINNEERVLIGGVAARPELSLIHILSRSREAAISISRKIWRRA